MHIFEGPTKIPRENPEEKEERMKIVPGKGKKSAKFWASHPSPPFGTPLFLASGHRPSEAPHPSSRHTSEPLLGPPDSLDEDRVVGETPTSVLVSETELKTSKLKVKKKRSTLQLSDRK